MRFLFLNYFLILILTAGFWLLLYAPWCYRAVQTMFYHSMLLGWGFFSIAFGAVKISIKRAWKSAVP